MILNSFYLIEPNDWYFQTSPDVIEAKRRAQEYFSTYGSYERAEYSIEEFVRQWVLKELITSYKYPISWFGEKVVIEETIPMGVARKQVDIAIKNDIGKPFILIETKNYSTSTEDFTYAQGQLESYLAATHYATIGLVTDGKTTKVLRKKIDPNDFDYIPDIPEYGLENTVKTKLVREIDPSLLHEGRDTGLTPIDATYERVLSESHNLIRDIDGLHDDEALDEICKVIYTKIYDERQTCKQPTGTPFRFQVFGAANASEVASNIRGLYDEAKQADIEIYSKRIPEYARSRGVFKANIRLSDQALFKVVESLQEFSLIDSDTDIKGRAFQKILASAIRAGMGQYFTPDPIAELAVKVVSPTASDMVLDPFCGSGHFLSKTLNYVLQDKNLTKYAQHEVKFFHLHGIEKSDRMVRIAMTDMLLHDDGHTNIRNQDALLSFENYPDIVAIDETSEELNPAVFDVVLTNPPFGSIMRQETMNIIGRFSLGSGKKSLPLEIIGLERSLQFLKPDGKLAIVLPEHIMKGKSTAFVRDWLSEIAATKAIFFFPEEAFTPYGAMVKTCLCVFQKYGEKCRPSDDEVTFLCEVENLGYDATGRYKHGSEIDLAVEAFKQNQEWA